jgi:hypothetical protein
MSCNTYCSKLFISGTVGRRLFRIMERNKPYKVSLEYLQTYQKDEGDWIVGHQYRPVYKNLKIFTSTEAEANNILKLIESRSKCYSCIRGECLADKLLKIANK